tara:strand:+ start:68 stop:277 length:210 start_codon:yes stop_codon:yes gene_type:complete
MLVTVHYVGNQFIAIDEQGKEITNRAILNQLQFEPFTGTQQTFTVEVDNATNDAIIEPIEVNINVNTQR